MKKSWSMIVFMMALGWLLVTPAFAAYQHPLGEAIADEGMSSQAASILRDDAGDVSSIVHGSKAARATITVCASGCDQNTIAAAITAASAGDTISLSAETLTETEITVNKNLTITGVDAASTIVQAAASTAVSTRRVFVINSGVTATFENLTIRHGNRSFGAGILTQGTLTVNNCIISDNLANSGTNGGAGILNAGTLTVNNSTFSGNEANADSGGGGAIRNFAGTLTINNSTFSGNTANGNNSGGGAIRLAGTAEINNSTFSGNTASASGSRGGAVKNDSNGTLTINNSTFSDNTTGDSFGAIDNAGTMHLSNTIIANSTGTGGNCTNSGTLATDTNNLIEGTHSCGSPTQTADPNLAALANNGGDTQTHALQAGSPAIDNGDNTACADAATINNRDERNAPRAGGAGSGGSTCDIGAYEYDSTPLVVTLASLQAVVTGEHVVVTWETVSELENLGFNLYRATSLDGAQEQLNSELISAQASGSGQGAAYEWVDDTVAAGMTYYYWLADVDLNGSETLHEPVSVTINTPTAITLDSLQSKSSLPLWGLLVLGLTLLSGAWLVRRRVAG